MSLENVEDIYPLTALQEGILFHAVSSPGSGVFVEQLSSSLTGSLQVKLLQQAWEMLVQRHSALRTSIVWDGLEDPFQVVHQNARVPWEFLDWREQDVVSQKQSFERLLDEDRKAGFSMSTAPLMRFHLVQQADNAWRLLWTFHHILIDGWSGALLIQEWLENYECLIHSSPLEHSSSLEHGNSLGRGSSLNRSEPFHYRDFIAWRQAWFSQRGKAEAMEKFWRANLAGFRAPTRIRSQPSETTPNPEGNSYRQIELRLTESTGLELSKTARKAQVTLNTLIQAAWALILSRHAKQQDVVFGVTSSGRPPELPEAQTCVGLFINTLPLRLNVTVDKSLLDWLKDVQLCQAHVMEFEQSSLAQVQKWSEVPPGSSLVDSILVFENYPTQALLSLENGSLHVGEFEHYEQSNFPLAMLVVPQQELRFLLIYDQRCIASHLARVVLEDFDQLLSAMIALRKEPESTVHHLLDGLGWLSQEASSGEVVSKSIPSSTSRSADGVDYQSVSETELEQLGGVYEWFSLQANRTPEACSLIFEDRRVSYGELEMWSNQVAHGLIREGVTAQDSVGLCLERSIEMIVGLLGILKTGASYIPLDPGYPESHNTFLLADAGVELVLGRLSGLKEARGSDENLLCPRTLGVENWIGNDALPVDPPKSTTRSDDTAYVVYTSGSSGRPKGVEISHGNLMYSNRARRSYYKDPVERFLLMSSVAFDSSVAGIFWTLCEGGTLVLPTTGQEVELDAVARLIASTRVTHTLLLPSLYRLLLEASSNAQLASLSTVVVAGESCSPKLCEDHFEKLPATSLYNEYGPTEATVWCSVEQLQPADTTEVVAIGSAIPGTEIVLVNRDGSPAVKGNSGEICVSGPGVAKGYRNRPELEARKFKLVADGQRRIYCTGDIGYYRSDGRLVYAGRMDRQVKIRGQRVELPAIESALLSLEGVTEAAVIGWKSDDEESTSMLVAYLVQSHPQDPEDRTGSGASHSGDSQLRHALRQTLPAFMVPSVFVFMDRLPKLANGKTDESSLPPPNYSCPSGSSQAGRTVVEKQLAEIWTDVLGLERVGIHDDFFSIGGDSLSSIRVVSAARKRGIQLDSPSTLLDHPTIAELALELESTQPRHTSPVLLRFNEVSEGVPLVFVHAGGLEGVEFRHLARYFPDRPVLATQSRGLSGGKQPMSVQDIAQDFLSELHSTLGCDRPIHLVGRCQGGPIALEMAHQLELLGTPPLSFTILDSGLKRIAPRVSFNFCRRKHKHLWKASAAWLKWNLVKPAMRFMDLQRPAWSLGQDLDAEDQEIRSRVHAANLRLIARYEPATISQPILLIRSSEYAARSAKDYHLAQWEKQTRAGLRTELMQCEHDLLCKEPVAATLSGFLNVNLHRTESQSGSAIASADSILVPVQ